MNILIVALKNMRQIMKKYLTEEGYINIDECDNYSDCYSIMSSKQIDVLLIDLDLDTNLDPYSIVLEITNKHKTTDIITLSEEFGDLTYNKLEELGIESIIFKPYLPVQILSEMERIKEERDEKYKNTNQHENMIDDKYSSSFENPIDNGQLDFTYDDIVVNNKDHNNEITESKTTEDDGCIFDDKISLTNNALTEGINLEEELEEDINNTYIENLTDNKQLLDLNKEENKLCENTQTPDYDNLTMEDIDIWEDEYTLDDEIFINEINNAFKENINYETQIFSTQEEQVKPSEDTFKINDVEFMENEINTLEDESTLLNNDQYIKNPIDEYTQFEEVSNIEDIKSLFDDIQTFNEYEKEDIQEESTLASNFDLFETLDYNSYNETPEDDNINSDIHNEFKNDKDNNTHIKQDDSFKEQIDTTNHKTYMNLPRYFKRTNSDRE